MGSLYGFEIKSELPLRRLNAAEGTRGELRVEQATASVDLDGQEPVSTLAGADGSLIYASYEQAGKCVLRLPPSGEFLIDPESLRVSVLPEGDGELLEHRIASAAICTLLAMRGDVVLHASAIAGDNGAVIFCGPTKRGKSTLVRTLGDLGHPVLGEDGIAIEPGAEPVAFPGARGVRIRSDARPGTVDTAPDPGPREPEPRPVTAIVLLGERGEEMEVGRLEPATALALLTPNLIHSGSRAAIGQAFAALARLLHSAPVFQASFPDDLGRLPESAEKLLDTVGARG